MRGTKTSVTAKRILRKFCKIRGIDFAEAFQVYKTLTVEQRATNILEVKRYNLEHDRYQKENKKKSQSQG